ncbi:YhcH/YjgK/YiaL family protein [uncultured Imperialibacter sp.]|uniref:YhcH/YjgK/YiaL family protein n=1 Tax=uncultured Imperialibacter sp. TaxID=1672639 RepID=UPI0030DB9966|tara:strand:- start:36310 stop:36933 length:624 start_codon:yes stop_codon:yes gene_type:complete
MHSFSRRLLSAVTLLTALSMCFELQAQSGKALGKKESKEWFKERKWLSNDNLVPHKSIDQQELARQYSAHKDWWDKAFAYMQRDDLASIKPGRYPIDGENVFVIVSDGPTKELAKTKYESHKVYADIHYVFDGKEKIGIAPVEGSTVTEPYDAEKEIMFHEAKGKYYEENPETFFVVFPGKDAHRPGVKVEGYDTVKKIVIKVRAGG